MKGSYSNALDLWLDAHGTVSHDQANISQQTPEANPRSETIGKNSPWAYGSDSELFGYTGGTRSVKLSE